MPFITLVDFEPYIEKNDGNSMGKIGIRVAYTVPQLDNKKRAIEVKFNNNVSKSSVYISKRTGAVFHTPSNNSQQSLKIWSKKISDQF